MALSLTLLLGALGIAIGIWIGEKGREPPDYVRAEDVRLMVTFPRDG